MIKGAWRAAAIASFLACAALFALGACSGGGGTGLPSRTTVPGEADRVVVSGEALLDGAPFDSRWVGAVVVRSGLVTPCQDSLPPVQNGHYSVTVLAETEASGCGGRGARVVLWTYAFDMILYSTDTVPWPATGQAATFAPHYSTADPAGARPVVAEFTGRVLGSDGQQLPPGTRVEAFVDNTRCGVASVRTRDTFTGYVVSVVGPDSIPGCTSGAPLTFHINGRVAAPTNAVNTPPGQHDALDLKLA